MAESYLILNLELPESFLRDLDRTINEEITLAQKKWKLKLTEEQKIVVFENARTQTRLKTSTIAKQAWDLGNKLAIRVPYIRNMQIELKPGVPVNKKIDLVMTKDGWVQANEETEYPINVANVLEKQITTILRWGQTAAFYGVGSYSR